VGEYDEGQFVRAAYDELLPDRREYDIEMILESVTGSELGQNLDQPIMTHLWVIAILRAPPSEPAPEISSRVRERDPDLQSELPPASRRRQDHEGGCGGLGC